MTSNHASTATTVSDERADLLESLRRHRYFLTVTARGLTDDQARLRPTASTLSIGGLIKHVTATELQWARFIVEGPSVFGVTGDAPTADEAAAWASGFEMGPDDMLSDLLAVYAEVAAATDALVRDLDDLDAGFPLPSAPWFEPGASWSARRALLHVIAETSQHAGHADIIRESIDGQKTMG